MSTAQAVTQHLPFLRRYARALTGSQQSGDAYVTAALEALIADPSVVSQASSPRVALYHLFTKIWNSVDVNAKSEPAADSKMPVEQRLGHITPLPRQAFLLLALEGFSEADAAAILETDVRSVRGLVEPSGLALASESPPPARFCRIRTPPRTASHPRKGRRERGDWRAFQRQDRATHPLRHPRRDLVSGRK